MDYILLAREFFKANYTSFLWIPASYFISWAFTRLIRGKPTPTLTPTSASKRSIFDRFVNIVLIVSAIYSLYSATILPENLLDTLKIKHDTPTWQFRNAFRTFMADKYDRWTEGSPSSLYGEDQAEIEEYETLYDLLKDTKNRIKYLNYGHNSFVNCDFCVENTDYFFYSLPDVLVVYVVCMWIVGFATMSSFKKSWRTMACIAASIILFFDIIAISAGTEEKMSVSPFSYSHLFRRLLFGTLFTVLHLFDRKDFALDGITDLENKLTAIVFIINLAYENAIC